MRSQLLAAHHTGYLQRQAIVYRGTSEGAMCFRSTCSKVRTVLRAAAHGREETSTLDGPAAAARPWRRAAARAPHARSVAGTAPRFCEDQALPVDAGAQYCKPARPGPPRWLHRARSSRSCSRGHRADPRVPRACDVPIACRPPCACVDAILRSQTHPSLDFTISDFEVRSPQSTKCVTFFRNQL